LAVRLHLEHYEGVPDLELEEDSKQVKGVTWLAQKKHLILAY
jgi:hypothetical protein